MIEVFPKICMQCAHIAFCRQRDILTNLNREVERAQTHLGQDTKIKLFVECKHFEEKK